MGHRTSSSLRSQPELLFASTPPIAQTFQSLFICHGFSGAQNLIPCHPWLVTYVLILLFLSLVYSSNSITPTATMTLTVTAVHPHVSFP